MAKITAGLCKPVRALYSPVHTGDYSRRRIRRQFVFGDSRRIRQCGQGLCYHITLRPLSTSVQLLFCV